MNAVPSPRPAKSFFCTIWRNNKGIDINAARDMDVRELERVIVSAPAVRDKDSLPLLKLARFGEIKTEKGGSLRHDANVLAVSGVEGDYDGSAVPMTMQHAADILSSIGMSALLYETASNTPDDPHWRVIAPLSVTMEGTQEELRSQRAHWTGVLNAYLGGVLKGESFTLSQSFYFGKIVNAPAPGIIRLEGLCIDKLENPPEPIIASTVRTETTRKERDENALAGLASIISGEHIYNVVRDYTARLVAKGVPPDEVHVLVSGFLRGHREAWNTDPTQQARFDEVQQKLWRMIEGADKYEPHNDDDQHGHAAEWESPVDILRDLSARAFDSADLPAVLSEYAKAYADNTGFDPSLTLTSAVCVAAAALSDVFQIVADSKTQWMQSARLWMLGIGRSGAGKTPAQREMLAPLWAIQRELMDEYDRTVRDLPEEERKRPPPRPRVILVDTTVEALSDVLQHNERGVVISNDEFEGFMGSLDQYRGKGGASRDRAEYLRLFDGGPHTVERVQRGSVFVKNFGVSIMSATTPTVLAKLARHLPEDGLLQRFIVVCVEKQRTAVSTADIEAARVRYHETIRRLYNAGPRAHKGKVPLSLEAADVFHAWRAQHQLGQEAMGAISTAFESHLAKHATLVLRVALVFHAAQIVNQPNPEARDIAAFPVSAETVRLALRFMRRAGQHAMSVYLGMQGGSQGFELARDIGRSILAHGGSQVARRDLIQRVRAFRAADDNVKNTALHILIDAGWIRYAEGGYAKAVPARYDVNPLLATKMATEAARERQRRAVVREMIAGAAADRRDG